MFTRSIVVGLGILFSLSGPMFSIAATAAPLKVKSASPQSFGFRHKTPESATTGLALAVTAYVPFPLTNPVLMYRATGGHGYNQTAFTAQPDGYFIAEIPAADVTAPGIEYYIVADSPGAKRTLAAGDPENPLTISVAGGLNEGLELKRYGYRNEVQSMSEYVQYPSRPGLAQDYYTRHEVEYLYRVFSEIYSLRFGSGYLSGHINAPVKVDVDAAGNSRPGQSLPADLKYSENNWYTSRDVGFLYAYMEPEFRQPGKPYSLSLRGIFGVIDTGVGGGAQARLRIGDELGVNFVVGATILSQLGFESFLQFNVRPSEKTFLTMASYLENLPLREDLGFRSHLDLRYLVTDNFSVLARAGATALDVKRIGLETGLGLGLSF